MQGLLSAGLHTALRHNITSLWLRSLLCCPSSSNVLGAQEAINAILNDKTPRALGIATPEADRLQHSFVASQDDFQWFEFWTRERSLWWKRHSYNRLRFDAARLDVDHSRIVYQNDHVIETLTKEYQGQTALIRSEIDLSQAVKWLLDDACSEDSASGLCTRLHYELTPYQVSVTVASDKLRVRAEGIIAKMKKMYVRCLPIIDVEPAITPNAFRNADLLGVCYNVYIGEDILETSIVRVRERDTATYESMYFEEVAYELARYLKGNAPVYRVSNSSKTTKSKKKDAKSKAEQVDTVETEADPVDAAAGTTSPPEGDPVLNETVPSAPEAPPTKVLKKHTKRIKVVKQAKETSD